jgi:hypothetical protein
VKMDKGELKRDGSAGRLFSRAEMRRTGRAMNGYPWPVRVPRGSQVCCTNYVGFVSARSKKSKTQFLFFTNLHYCNKSSIDAVTMRLEVLVSSTQVESIFSVRASTKHLRVNVHM